jgi:hypothetical protein
MGDVSDRLPFIETFMMGTTIGALGAIPSYFIAKKLGASEIVLALSSTVGALGAMVVAGRATR